MFTNDGFGLLRVLSADIYGFIIATILIVLAVLAINAIISGGGNHADPDTLSAKRTTRRVGFWIWFAVLVGLLAHTAATVASLRIPRSDVKATGVYIDMNRAIEGRSPR